jgi:hypothetical protein
MAKRRRSSLGLSGEHAQQALAVLVHDGKLAAGEVQKALKRHKHLVTDLRAELAALEEGVGKVGMQVLKDGPFPMARKARTARRKVARRKPRISAATRKLYQQQGRFMAALRNRGHPRSQERQDGRATREAGRTRGAARRARGLWR